MILGCQTSYARFSDLTPNEASVVSHIIGNPARCCVVTQFYLHTTISSCALTHSFVAALIQIVQVRVYILIDRTSLPPSSPMYMYHHQYNHNSPVVIMSFFTRVCTHWREHRAVIDVVSCLDNTARWNNGYMSIVCMYTLYIHCVVSLSVAIERGFLHSSPHFGMALAVFTAELTQCTLFVYLQ